METEEEMTKGEDGERRLSSVRRDECKGNQMGFCDGASRCSCGYVYCVWATDARQRLK